MGTAASLGSIYVLRPAVAIVACALVAVAVEDASRTVIQVALLTPTVVALVLIAIDGNRHAFAASGYAGAVAFGFTAAALEAAETIAGFDLGFILMWVMVSAISSVPVYGISFVWAATGTIVEGIDELVEARHDAQLARADSDGMELPDALGPSPVTTPPIIPGAPGSPMLAAAAAPSIPAPASERPANFDAEELVAGLEAYQVGGLPWWRSSEPYVMVPYRDRAQMDIEARVVPFYGWKRETVPQSRPSARAEHKRGTFTFQFNLRPRLPDEDLTVLWTRETPSRGDDREANEETGA